MDSANLKKARKNKNYTQAKLAQLLQVSRATVAMWETQNSQPDNDTLIDIADILEVSTDYLLGRTDDPYDYENDPDLEASTYNLRKELGIDLQQARNIQKAIDEDIAKEWSNINLKSLDRDPSISFEVIGDVAAHFGADAIQEDDGIRVDIPQSWLHGSPASDFFVLRVSGDSMYPDYQDGDYVLVRKQSSVDSGTIAIMLYDDRSIGTMKKVNYVPGEDWLELIPRNPEYKTRRIEGSELDGCKVLGEVIRLIRIVKS